MRIEQVRPLWHADVGQREIQFLALFDDDRPTDRDREIRALVAGLDDPDFRVREKASSDLAALGAEAKKALLRVLADGSPEARHRARVLLGAIKSPAPSDEARKRRNLRMQQRIQLKTICGTFSAWQDTPYFYSALTNFTSKFENSFFR